MQNSDWQKSRSFLESCRYAWRGVLHVFRTQRNMRIQVVIYAIAIILAMALNLSSTQQVLIILASTLILVLEMVNTAVEDLADVIEPTYHGRIGTIKDVIAGAVMVASFSAILIAFLLFGPPLYYLAT